MGGARDRHCGDSEVLGATKEIILGRGRDGGFPQTQVALGSFLLRAPSVNPSHPIRSPLPQQEAGPAPHSERVCHDLSSSVIGPLGEAYEKLPA